MDSQPAGRPLRAGARAARGFHFFRACVQKVFATPREGHIACSNCHAGGLVGFAPPPQNGKAWSDEEAKRAFQSISRLIIPGNPEQSRFLLKPLHPDGGGTYTHNGPRRWQSRSDPEWQMLAGWVRGERERRDLLLTYPRGFAPRTPQHALSRAACVGALRSRRPRSAA